MSSDLLEYYSRRAGEYERIYDRPERTQDLRALTALLQRSLAEERVLELACGTGYWTTRIATVARSVCATDAAARPLELARRKSFPPGRVRLELGDAYTPEIIPGDFTTAFAGFWWSHVPLERLPGFLDSLHARMGVGARVVVCDNRYVEQNSTPIARTDGAGNQYQQRRLEGGEPYEVLKNFPTAAELHRLSREHGAVEIELVELTYYWFLAYRVGEVLS